MTTFCLMILFFAQEVDWLVIITSRNGCDGIIMWLLCGGTFRCRGEGLDMCRELFAHFALKKYLSP